ARLPLQQSLRRRDDQPRPASKETKATNRSNNAKPVPRLRDQRHEIQAPAEKQDPRKQQPPRAAINGTEKRENEQRDRVNEMIKNGLVPGIQHAAPFES